MDSIQNYYPSGIYGTITIQVGFANDDDDENKDENNDNKDEKDDEEHTDNNKGD